MAQQFLYIIKEMTEEAAYEIATWQYAAPYEIYSFTDNEAEVDELLNGLHFAIYSNDSLVGFAAIGWSAQIQDEKVKEIYSDESYTDIAFGLKPELCGQGHGACFVNSIISYVKELFEDDGIRLTVHRDNKRACKLYEKLGFKEIHAFDTDCIQNAPGKNFSMSIMVL